MRHASPSDDARARRYHRLQLAATILGFASAVAFLIGVLVTGAGTVLARWIAAVAASPALQVGGVAMILGIAYHAVSFPLTFWRSYWLPRRFGLLHQSFRSWSGDRLKAALIGGALGLAAIEMVYALLRLTPYWWLIATGVFITAYVLMAVVVPVWLVPLFYRLAPLADDALTTRLLGLARRLGVPAVGVWVADQSRKSRTANAMLAGLGPTRRIILFDTLIAQFTPDEIETILAHELGHHINRDLWRGLVAQSVLTLVTLAVADVALARGVRWLGLDGPADPAGVAWLGLVMMALGAVAAPLANGFSRWVERQADDVAIATTGKPAAFVSAMERLARLNLAERRPHRLKEILLYSHPAIDRRIARALSGG